jgi:alpha-D-ribose 1-methylphosphonate 5-triphosphate synthase subunit PhnH
MYCRETGDAATDHIAELQLQLYYAGKTHITDRSLEVLAQMQSLQKLEFWEVAGITDHGIAALAKLPNLREISVEGSPNVTRAGMAVFPAAVRVSY